MFDPRSWLRFWEPRLRNRSVLVVFVRVPVLLSVKGIAGKFETPATKERQA